MNVRVSQGLFQLQLDFLLGLFHRGTAHIGPAVARPEGDLPVGLDQIMAANGLIQDRPKDVDVKHVERLDMGKVLWGPLRAGLLRRGGLVGGTVLACDAFLRRRDDRADVVLPLVEGIPF